MTMTMVVIPTHIDADGGDGAVDADHDAGDDAGDDADDDDYYHHDRSRMDAYAASAKTN